MQVVDLLSSESEGPFGIHNSTDYEDVGFYTDLLNVVLTDIDDYVNEERNISQPDTMESPGKRNGKDKPLQIIISLLNRIYGKIGELSFESVHYEVLTRRLSSLKLIHVLHILTGLRQRQHCSVCQ
jgi:hypothetical protein